MLKLVLPVEQFRNHQMAGPPTMFTEIKRITCLLSEGCLSHPGANPPRRQRPPESSQSETEPEL